jgi:phosphatidylserine/phosphatidylglycerophosphate/cardiolipin synthase-like enzyme
MDDAELVGGVLIGAADPRAASQDLAELLQRPSRDDRRARELGFDPELVAVLQRRLPSDAERIKTLCSEAAAWVMGRRSVAVPAPWELVASLPPGGHLPRGLHRTTGETLLSLVSEARTTLRITAPFLDETAVTFLADALVAATSRGVSFEVFTPTRSTHAPAAIAWLADRLTAEGDPTKLRRTSFRDDAPWAHLKVFCVDSAAAYIGSANVTGPALAGPNLELGVLVRGPQVQTIESLLDLFRA